MKELPACLCEHANEVPTGACTCPSNCSCWANMCTDRNKRLQPPVGHVVCPQCKGLLQRSGNEPTRHICQKCGQNYYAVLQFVPTSPIVRPLALTATSQDVTGDDAE